MVFIAGSSGMLGSSLLKLLKYDNVVGNGNGFDITDAIYVNKTLNKIKPNVIIHTAAYTDVEGCEKNPEKAYKINTIGTQNLVNYCIDKNILFIYISSTGLYGDSKEESYTEFDSVNPTTIHHKSKYEAEKIVKNHLCKFLILRTGWLFGGSIEHTKNFVYQRYLEAIKKDIVYSDASQIGNPTYVVDFVKQIEVLIDKKQYGVYNCVNEANNISRYDYVKKIIELFEINSTIKVASSSMFKRVAPVSKNESAINYKLNLLDLNIMRSWQEALASYIEILKSDI